MQVLSLGQKDPLEEEMATHSKSYYTWKIQDPGRLQFMGSQSQTGLSMQAAAAATIPAFQR